MFCGSSIDPIITVPSIDPVAKYFPSVLIQSIEDLWHLMVLMGSNAHVVKCRMPECVPNAKKVSPNKHEEIESR